MKKIIKHFKSLRAAEAFLNKLYDKYSHATCTAMPFLSEAGIYTFEVRE